MVTGRRTRSSRLDVHQSYLQRRIDDTDGVITVKDLREELAVRGHRVPYSSLRDWARSRLERSDAPAPTAAAPSVRTVVGWITRHPDTLTEDESSQLKAVLDACPELDQTHQLVRVFTQMLARRTDHFKSGRFRLEVTTGELLEVGEAESSAEDRVLELWQNTDLLNAVRRLTPRQQKCVTLRFLQGLSLAETARVMGRSEGAIKTLQRRAIRSLTRLLSDDTR